LQPRLKQRLKQKCERNSENEVFWWGEWLTNDLRK